MNAKRFTEAMGELDDKYIDEVLSYRRASASKIRPKRIGMLIAAIIAALALCGFATYELGLLIHGSKNRQTIRSEPFKAQLRARPKRSTPFLCA